MSVSHSSRPASRNGLRPSAEPPKDCSAILIDVVIPSFPPGQLLSRHAADINDFLEELGPKLHNLTTTASVHLSREPPPSPIKSMQQSHKQLQELGEVLSELVKTERNYNYRLRVLKEGYLDQLVAEIYRYHPCEGLPSKYELQQLSRGVERIAKLNAALLQDLEISLTGHKKWAEVLAEHLKHFQAAYDEYLATFSSNQALASTLMDNPDTRILLEKLRGATAQSGRGHFNLKDLLAEPYQRITRYRDILKKAYPLMGPDDPNFAFVEDGLNTADKIASFESDFHEYRRRNAVIHGLKQAISNFPAGFVNQSRVFLAAANVEDVSREGSTGKIFGVDPVYATLFLFNDHLIIAKRPRDTLDGKTAAGLADINGLVDDVDAGISAPTSPKRSPTRSPSRGRSGIKMPCMSFRGSIRLETVSAVDLGQAGFALYFAEPPSHFSATWSERRYRRFIVTRTTSSRETPHQEKQAFLQNFWHARSTVATFTLPPTIKSSTHVRKQRITLSTDESVDVYFAIWRDEQYRHILPKARLPLAMHVLQDGAALDYEIDDVRSLSVHLTGPKRIVISSENEEFDTPDAVRVCLAHARQVDSICSVPPRDAPCQDHLDFDTATVSKSSLLSRGSTMRTQSSRQDTTLSFPTSKFLDQPRLMQIGGSPVLVQKDPSYESHIGEIIDNDVTMSHSRIPTWAGLKRQESQDSFGSGLVRSRLISGPVQFLKKSIGHSASADQLTQNAVANAHQARLIVLERGRAKSVPVEDVPAADQSMEVLDQLRTDLGPFNGPRPISGIRQVSGQKRARQDSITERLETADSSFARTDSYESIAQYSLQDNTQVRKKSKQDLVGAASATENVYSQAIQKSAMKLKSQLDHLRDDVSKTISRQSSSDSMKPLRNQSSNGSLTRTVALQNIKNQARDLPPLPSEKHPKLDLASINERLDGLYVFADNLQEQCRQLVEDTAHPQTATFKDKDDKQLVKLQADLEEERRQRRLLEQKVQDLQYTDRTLREQVSTLDNELDSALELYRGEVQKAYTQLHRAHPNVSVALTEEVKTAKVAIAELEAELSRNRRQLQLQGQLVHIRIDDSQRA